MSLVRGVVAGGTSDHLEGQSTAWRYHRHRALEYEPWPRQRPGDRDRRLVARQHPRVAKGGVCMATGMWVVVKMMVPCWFLNIIRHPVFRGPQKRPSF